MSAEYVRSVPLIKSNISYETEESVLVTPRLIQEHDNILPLQILNSLNSSDDFASFVLLEDKNEQLGNTTQIAILNSSKLESPTNSTHRNLLSRMETTYRMFLKIANLSSHSDKFTSTTTSNNIITKKKYSIFRKNTGPSSKVDASTSIILDKTNSSKDAFLTDKIEKVNLSSSFIVEDSVQSTKMKRSSQPQNRKSNQKETDLKRGIKNETPQDGTGIQNDNDLKRGIKNRTHVNGTGNQNDNDLKRGIKNRTPQNGASSQSETDLKRGIENTTLLNASENVFLGKGVPPIVGMTGTTNCGRSNLVCDMIFVICSFIFILQ